MTSITLTIEEPNLNPYSKRQYNADVYCKCCGRGIANRNTATVAIVKQHDDLSFTFEPITDKVLGRDSVEWGTFIGSHCAKKLPKTHKITQKRVMTAWKKAGYP
jgi:hypothetical protein